MKKQQNKLQTARRRDAWLTTREHKRSTKQTNEEECSQPKIEFHFHVPVNSIVLHADSIFHERRGL